ncbi:MAG: putative RNA uridine N3 methyltransferase [Candidatus Bathyarchaeia archaeon]|nr:RNA-binding protein [Candidatus Bathyarchaeota archaeon]
MVQHPPRRKWRLCIAIPASLTEDTPHLREKTFKVGLVGRASSIFRVEDIMIYRDKPEMDQRETARLAEAILKYMDTPQYLRRSLIRLNPNLKYVGILPPLRTPHHQVSKNIRDLKVGDFRQGVVSTRIGGKTLIDVGLDKPVTVDEKLPKGLRLTVRIVKVDGEVEAVKVPEDEISIYWGYNVTVTNLPLAESTRKVGFDLVVATSRFGRMVSEVLPRLQSTLNESRRVLVAFGSPTEGLSQILAKEGLSLNEYADYTVNTVPNQGVETVRSEEAIYATLSIINMLG